MGVQSVLYARTEGRSGERMKPEKEYGVVRFYELISFQIEEMIERKQDIKLLVSINQIWVFG